MRLGRVERGADDGVEGRAAGEALQFEGGFGALPRQGLQFGIAGEGLGMAQAEFKGAPAEGVEVAQFGGRGRAVPREFNGLGEVGHGLRIGIGAGRGAAGLGEVGPGTGLMAGSRKVVAKEGGKVGEGRVLLGEDLARGEVQLALLAAEQGSVNRVSDEDVAEEVVVAGLGEEASGGQRGEVGDDRHESESRRGTLSGLARP